MLVLLVGWLCLGDNISPRKLVGMITAVVGMVAYGLLSSQRLGVAGAVQGSGSGNKSMGGGGVSNIPSLPSYSFLRGQSVGTLTGRGGAGAGGGPGGDRAELLMDGKLGAEQGEERGASFLGKGR